MKAMWSFKIGVDIGTDDKYNKNVIVSMTQKREVVFEVFSSTWNVFRLFLVVTLKITIALLTCSSPCRNHKNRFYLITNSIKNYITQYASEKDPIIMCLVHILAKKWHINITKYLFTTFQTQI